MSQLAKIPDMFAYLKHFGKVLGKKATEALDPLYVPNESPAEDFSDIVAFNPDREPYESQAHVIAAASRMLDHAGAGFIVGEMGCIAGESEVYDPVAQVYRRVDQITEPFHVVSWSNGKAVVGRAHVPFIKGTRNLYRVKLSNGRSFLATSNHKMMVMLKDHQHSQEPKPKWMFVYEVMTLLMQSGPVPLPSIEERGLSGSPPGDPRSSRTAPGCQDDCSTGHHPCGGRPPRASDTDRVLLPSQDGVPEHTRVRSQTGGSDGGPGCSPPAAQRPGPLATGGSATLIGHTTPGDAFEPRLSSGPCGPGGSPFRDDPQFAGASLPPDTTRSSDRPASRSCCESPSLHLGEFEGDMVHVTEILYERSDIYYDFTVDVYHNYVLEGVVHHNTGKTICGMLAVHKHAKGKPYRAIVLCPDHLIGKWCRELETTIPGARVLPAPDPKGGRKHITWRDILAFYDKAAHVATTTPSAEPQQDRTCDVSTGPDTFETVAMTPKPTAGKTVRRRGKWRPPVGPEWLVIGRDQAKWMPKWVPIIEPHVGFGGNQAGGLSARQVVVSHDTVKDDKGRTVYDARGYPKKKAVTAKATYCPRCGHVPLDNKGNPVSSKEIASKRLSCEGVYLKEVEPEQKSKEQEKPHNFDRVYHLEKLHDRVADIKPGRRVRWRGKDWMAVQCGEPLWNWTARPYKWPPAKIVQKKLRGMFKYLIIDEVHEQKADNSARAHAAGALIGSARHVLALTGTLIGGYADDLFPLMIRMGCKSLIDEGFKWKGEMAFAEAYGKIETVVTTKTDGGGGPDFGVRNSNSMRKESGKPTSRQHVAPGIMPPLFGNHLMSRSIFITLEEMADDLPHFVEYVGGPPKIQTDDYDFDQLYEEGFVQTAVEMDEEQKVAYEFVENALTAAAKDLLRRGSMKLLATMLRTTLDYPDRPFGWTHKLEVKAAIERAVKEGADINPEHIPTVGYWDKPKSSQLSDWMGVVTPPDCERDRVRPKEQALIDICLKEKALKRQVWVYCQMTGKRDIQDRLKSLLEARGLKVGVLRSTTAKRQDREAWIEKNGPDYDVVLSHPTLVSTGLDLFAKDGRHNFCTLVFYQTGYSMFDLRQASRRAWRIGQPHVCKVYYLFYRHTMQERAMQLMSRKMAACSHLDGEFSAEGLAALAGDDNAQVALARSLSENISPEDLQRNWGKVKSGGGKKRKAAAAQTNRPAWLDDPEILDALFEDSTVPAPGTPSPLDGLPIEAQLVAETLVHYDEVDLADDHHHAVPPAADKLSVAGPSPVNEGPLTRKQAADMLHSLLAAGLSLEDILGDE